MVPRKETLSLKSPLNQGILRAEPAKFHYSDYTFQQNTFVKLTLCLVLLSLAGLCASAADCVELQAKSGARVWVYLPSKQAPSLPCVLVPPAGTRLFHGIRMTDGDRSEHWPYVERGFIVVSFDIAGELDDVGNSASCLTAIQAFLAADCGVADAKSAFAVACDRFRQIDRSRLYVAGHSSAATLALQIAASDLHVEACVAMAPIGDLAQRFGASQEWFDRLVPGSYYRLVSQSPVNIGSRIRCPVFLFHALDDSNVAPDEVLRLKSALLEHSVTVKYSTAEQGGHYDSMIQFGVPAAAAWLSEIDQSKRPNEPLPRMPAEVPSSSTRSE